MPSWLPSRAFENNLVGIAGKTGTEFGFNNFRSVFKVRFFMIAFQLACGSWLSLAKWPNQTAYLVALAAVAHRRVDFRMWLEGRRR